MLYLQNNYLTGGIPATISNCESLESLDLSLNYINGSIPTSVGSLARLRDSLALVRTLLIAFPCLPVTAEHGRAAAGRARRCPARVPLPRL